MLTPISAKPGYDTELRSEGHSRTSQGKDRGGHSGLAKGRQPVNSLIFGLDPKRPNSRRKGDVGGSRLWQRPRLIIDLFELLNLGLGDF